MSVEGGRSMDPDVGDRDMMAIAWKEGGSNHIQILVSVSGV